MPNTINGLWVYLSASPLFGLTLTLIAYGIGYRLYSAAKSNPLINPVLIAIAIIITVLTVLRIPYQDYFAGGQFIHFLLGPATVGLALPLYKQVAKLKRLWLPISLALLFGVSLASVSTLLIAKYLGASHETLLSLAPKSVTTPVAMSITEQLGGVPSLTAVFVIITGIIGAIVGSSLFRLLRIQDDSVKGIAMGITAHGIGTARAFQISAEKGAFSGLAMALSALVASLLVPWLVSLVI
ncbi:MAG: LrgB family protein [Thiotrichaceae bacterium]|jgi:predicted murein hydrolase (TIGR00659 family)|uniref:LrgB family protein n=1 Tax=Candidatus Thiocaldithrix dubininis TaxID=3080823 RepID=A0AA95H2M2_9GAMM|nr:MAG: LrgB family protein [Candidatus Thiocaldithrix dubininis]